MNDPKSTDWQVIIHRQAEKAMRRLDRPLRKRLDKAIQSLAQNPYPPNSRQLVGYKNDYRLRVGSWRIIYTVREEKLVIVVIKVASRGQVYKNK